MCDSIVRSTPQGVWLAKNSDREPGEAQAVEQSPAARAPGTRHALRRCTHVVVADTEPRRAMVVSRPAWMWGAEMGVNGSGLAIANEAVFTRMPVATQGLTGMDLLRLALERADTAREGVEVITGLLRRHPQGGRMGHRAGGVPLPQQLLARRRPRARWASCEAAPNHGRDRSALLPCSAMADVTDEIRRARAQWSRPERPGPARIETPGEGQESAWSYPRPPWLAACAHPVRVEFGGELIASTTAALRVLETSHPPTYYVPPADVRWQWLVRAPGSSMCEWKGAAVYWTVRVGARVAERAAWSYPDPFEEFAALRDHVAFYCAAMDACFVGDERARPQPGGFYGGWITRHVVGPFKGGPGTAGW